jgi:predicted lactoylglutathione lyase
MVYGVFAYKKELGGKVDEVLRDDLVMRQSITHRTGDVLGVGADFKVVFIEGSEEALKKATEMLKALGVENRKDHEALWKKLKDEEAAASEGFGAIFG